jgi:hypothetical protein
MAPILPLLGIAGAKLGALATGVGGAMASNAGLIGTGLAAAGTIYSGVRAHHTAKWEAKQMKAKGDEEQAIAQREATRRRAEKDRLLSRVRAVAGASGGGVGDPTVTQIMANIEQEGEYNALAEMYRGTSSRSTLRAEAAVRKSEGKGAMIGSFLDAGSTIYSGIERRRRASYDEGY